MLELDALIALEDHLVYRPEHMVNGEHSIARAHNHPWRRNSVPAPSTKNREYLASALASVGSPADPRPDIVYGYAGSVFDQCETDVLVSLPCDASVHGTGGAEELLFPYFVIEWKSSRGGGTMWDAERQCMRDGAAAVSAMHNFFRAVGVQEPSAADTACFSACVDSRIVVLRVHWRCVDAEGGVSYEADVVGEGFLRSDGDCYRVRGEIGEMLEWARGERLDVIREALGRRLVRDEGEEGMSERESPCGEKRKRFVRFHRDWEVEIWHWHTDMCMQESPDPSTIK